MSVCCGNLSPGGRTEELFDYCSGPQPPLRRLYVPLWAPAPHRTPMGFTFPRPPPSPSQKGPLARPRDRTCSTTCHTAARPVFFPARRVWPREAETSEFGLGNVLDRDRTSVGFEWMWRELLVRGTPMRGRIGVPRHRHPTGTPSTPGHPADSWGPSAGRLTPAPGPSPWLPA